MVSYEYQCSRGHYFINYYKMGEAPKEDTCPCGEKGVRVFSILATPNTLGGMSYGENKREYYRGEDV